MPDMVPGWIAPFCALLGISIGIFASHATLGNKVTRALTLLEGLDGRVKTLEIRPHMHRRAGDPMED